MIWMTSCKAGFSKKHITINFPVNLSGFAENRVASRIKDSIDIRVIVWEINQEQYLWINYDLIAVDDLLLNELYKKINIPKERIFVSATHTHSSVGGCLKTDEGIFNGYEYLFCKTRIEIMKSILNDTVLAVEEAFNDVKHVEVNKEFGTITNVCSNRNNPSFKGDPSLFVLEVKQKQGKKILIYNFACHPTILNQMNVEVSADFPGVVNQKFNSKGYYFSMFINGSAGDISTRFTRKKNGTDELNRIGDLIFTQIESCSLDAVNMFDVQVSNFIVDLSTKVKKNSKVAEKELIMALRELEQYKQNKSNLEYLRLYESRYEGATASYYFSKYFPEEICTISVNIQIWKIFDMFIVCVPGELFSELSNTIKKENVYFASYSNGYLGYFSDENGYDNNVYEALSSPFKKGQSEHMICCIHKKINEMR